jgi:hypothetical protein
MPQGPGEKDLFADLTVKHGREAVELLKAGELDPRFGQQLTAVSEKMGDKMVPPPQKKSYLIGTIGTFLVNQRMISPGLLELRSCEATRHSLLEDFRGWYSFGSPNLGWF